VRFALLGPLEVSDGDGPVLLGGPKQRVVLAHLVLGANRVIPIDRLIDALWGEHLPEEPKAALQVYVSRLRSGLGQNVIEGHTRGYVLHAEPDEIDAFRFEELLREARRGTVDPRSTMSLLDEALELWRGPALADLATEASLSGEIARLDELHLQAIEERIGAQLALGRHADVIGELEALTAAHPLRERVWALLMLALYRSGRQADALSAYQRARELLADELGIDPTADLRILQEQILRHDPELDLDGRPLRGYRLLEKIGEGSFGVVHRAIQPHVGREVAIKAIVPELANEARFIRRFEAEAQIVARLEGPHIVPLYDYWRDPEGAYLVMRYLSGGSLRRKIEEEGSIRPTELARLVDQIAQALGTAHRQGIVHRDIKPENILLDGEGNAYVTDFGIAKDVSDPRATKTGPIGTPVYLAPEQIRGEPVSPATDVHALGVVLYEALTGRQPFPDGSIATLLHRNLNDPLPSVLDVRPDLPMTIDDVIARATAKDPGSRLADAPSLAAAFAAAIGPSSGEVAAHAEAANPFKGLRPFVEADAEDFFGRAALIERLVARLREDVEGSRFLAVVGPSGSGKSSAVRAGLVPALRDGALAGSAEWFYVEMAPGAHPLEELEAALLRVAARSSVSLLEVLEGDEHGLADAVRQALPPGAELVLVIDQLEEVFTLVEDEAERRRFLDGVRVAVTEPDAPVRIVTTLRADFYDRPLAYRGFAELVRQRTEPVVPLSPEELERAIAGPAENVGVAVDPALIAQMVVDVAEQPGALPLMQYALTELFELRSDGVLSAQAYREIGGVAGALARRAEQLFDSMNATGQKAAEQLFLRLVALGEGAEDTRRRVSRSELDRMGVDGRALEAVIDAFARHRLLSLDRDPETREPTVEVAHEALLREWQRLRAWIDAARDDLRTERRLAGAVAEWEAAGRDPSFLLRGSRLDQLASWAAATNLAIAQTEREFLDASLELAGAERAAETERAERERILERRSLRRLRTAVAVFAVAALVAAGLTVVATRQSDRAEDAAHRAARQARIAGARELVGGAVANLEADPELSILLAIEAIERTRSFDGSVLPEAEDALHQAVGASRIELTVPGVGDRVAWSPDGAFAAERADGDGVVEIRDAETGALVRSLQAHAGDVTGVAFSRDGTMLATTGSDGKLNVWTTLSGELRSSVQHVGRALSPAFDEEGSLVGAVWEADASVRIARPATGRVIRTASVPPGLLCFGPDLRRVAVAGDSRAVVVDLSSGRTIRLDSGSDLSSIDSLAWSPDGRSIAISSTGSADVIDAETGRFRFALPHEEWVHSVAWTHDSTRVVTGGAKTAKVWMIEHGRPEEVLTLSPRLESGEVKSVAFSPDGSRLITSDAGTTKVWDVGVSGDAEVANLPWTANYSDVVFMPGDEQVVTVDWGRRHPYIAIWDLGTGEVIRRVGPTGGYGYGFTQGQFDLSSDGEVVAALSGTGKAGAWDVASGERLFAVPWDELISQVDWNPDGTQLLLASLHGWVRIVDRSGREIRVLREDEGYEVLEARFSPDGRIVAMSARPQPGVPGLEPRTTVRDMVSDEVLSTIGGAGWFAFAPEGDRFVIGREDGPAEVWDLQSGTRLATLAGTAVTDVAFSPDGTRIAAGSQDGTVRLFDAATGGELLVLRGRDTVGYVAFSSDGSMLISSGEWDVVRVWALDLDDLLEIARDEVTRSLTDAECRQYLHVDTCPPAGPVA